MRLVQLKAHTSKTQKGLDQSLASAHAHIQRENATAALRLCARPPVPDGENSRRGAVAQRREVEREGCMCSLDFPPIALASSKQITY